MRRIFGVCLWMTTSLLSCLHPVVPHSAARQRPTGAAVPLRSYVRGHDRPWPPRRCCAPRLRHPFKELRLQCDHSRACPSARDLIVVLANCNACFLFLLNAPSFRVLTCTQFVESLLSLPLLTMGPGCGATHNRSWALHVAPSTAYSSYNKPVRRITHLAGCCVDTWAHTVWCCLHPRTQLFALISPLRCR